MVGAAAVTDADDRRTELRGDALARIKQWKDTVAQLEATKRELTSATAQEPIRFDDDDVRAHVTEMRRLLDHGSVAARRAFLREWIKRIEVRERTLSTEYTFPVSPFGIGGEFNERVDQAEVGKAPRNKGGGAPAAKGGPVNAANRGSTPVNSGRGASVLSTGQDGSPCDF